LLLSNFRERPLSTERNWERPGVCTRKGGILLWSRKGKLFERELGSGKGGGKGPFALFESSQREPKRLKEEGPRGPY